MPIYEYQCPKCSEVHELWQSKYDSNGCECPACAVPMHKLISTSSFQLKGGGWYADGYCKKREDKCMNKTPVESASCAAEGTKEQQMCAACN